MSFNFHAQTEEDFFKARNKALFNEIQHFINQDETHLLSFNDIKQLLKPKNEVYLGMQAIPVEMIVGSEGRYHDFDNHFFPKNLHLKNRWERIDEAHLQDIVLPPIKLYEIGGLYFVRDGNHRVSVAKAKGIECIDAEVVSLKSEIKLKAGMSKSKILKQVLNYEKRVFYMETAFGDITDFWKLDFSTPGQYDVIYNHILTHKYFINQNYPEELTMQDAIASWYENVYCPVVAVIKKRHLMRKFKHRTISDMYVWLIKYWDDLKTKFGDSLNLDEAATGFTKEYGLKSPLDLLKRFAKK